MVYIVPFWHLPYSDINLSIFPVCLMPILCIERLSKLLAKRKVTCLVFGPHITKIIEAATASSVCLCVRLLYICRCLLRSRLFLGWWNYNAVFFVLRGSVGGKMVDTQHFCLRWNNYQSSITSAFENLRDDEDFVDVTLACEGKSLKAHRVVLSACSPYFRELLKVREFSFNLLSDMIF